MPMALEKGVLGEIEAPFALWLGLALAAQFAAANGRPRLALLGGLALGLAVLTKGPAAWVLAAAAGAGRAALEPRRALAHLLPALVSMAVSALCAGAWVLPLAQRVGWGTLKTAWLGEVGASGPAVSAGLLQRLEYLGGTAAGFLPASALLLALAPRNARRGGLPALVRFALVLSGGAVLFFLLYPRCQPRYAFPAAPWVALAGGYALAQSLAAFNGGPRSARGAAWPRRAFGGSRWQAPPAWARTAPTAASR